MWVFLRMPVAGLTAITALYLGGSSMSTMSLAGFALVFSRLIDNAVIVLENIFRHMGMGESPEVAAEKGGDEVALAVLAAIGFWAYALVDLTMTDELEVRLFSKPVWVLLLVLTNVLGSLLWLFAGRPQRTTTRP